MKFDDVLQEIGEFGGYQKRVYFLASFPMILAAFEALSTIFIFYIPPHRCAIPGFPNDQFHAINDTHLHILNLTIPKNEDGTWSECRRYSDVSHDIIRMNTSDVTAEGNGNHSDANTTTCDRWVYDHSVLESTIPSDLDIVCERRVFRASSNMVAEVGSMLGTLVSGCMADRYGRKVPFYLAGLALIGGGFGIAFTTSFLALNICRFFIGTSRMALFINGFVIGMELVGPSKRVLAGTLIELLWCVGMLILLLLAYMIRNWRYLEIAVSIPSLFLLAYWWLIPESPRWLAAKGRKEEALKVLEKIAASNGTTLPKMDDVTQLLEAERTLSFRHVFQSRELVLRVFILFCNMFVMILIYYALMYNITNLSGNIYLNYLLNIVMETLGYIAPYLVLDRLGRKKVYCGSIFIGAGACVACILPAYFQAPDWIITMLASGGRFCVCVAFSTLYIYGTELFPTVVRASAMGVGVTFARVGGMCAPYLADVGILVGGWMEKALPMVIMGCPALLVALLSLWLPETKGTRMPETLQDVQPRERKCCFSRDKSSDLASSEEETAKVDMQTTTLC